MSTDSWAGLAYEPGQEVTLKAGLGSGVIGGRLYNGPKGPLYIVDRGSSPIEVGEGTITSAEPAPVFTVGEMTSRGEVLERWDREDAPGFMYRVKIGTDSEGNDRSTVVGPEKLKAVN